MREHPRDWCDPPNAFGQLFLKDGSRITTKPIKHRRWSPPAAGTDPTAFRAAVVQNAISLHIKTAKNSIAHPKFPDNPQRTFPLDGFAKLDPRGVSPATWGKKLTGERDLTLEDVATVMDVFPGAMPSEAEIKVFLDVAWKRVAPPLNWPWPDS